MKKLLVLFMVILRDTLAEGQLLGSHIGSTTMSDIAVGVETPKEWKPVSYFDIITDSLFQKKNLPIAVVLRTG